MKWMRSLVALGVAALLGFAAWRLPDAGDVRVAGARRPLVPTGGRDTERVAEIVLEREGERLRFELRDGRWIQTEPVQHPLDGWAVRQLVSRVLNAESIRSIEPGAPGSPEAIDPAAAGLSPPVGRIVLREAGVGADARTLEVELGRRSLAGRAYARVAGGPRGAFDVVDAALGEFALDRDPRDFRRRDLFPDLGEVRRISLSTTAGRVVLARDGAAFMLEDPVRSRADRQQATELVEALRRARSDGFIVDRPADLAPYGLAPPAATLEIDEPGARRKLFLGNVVSLGAQDRFGLVEGTESVVRIPAEVLATAVPRAERLVDAVAAGVRAQDVGAIEIVSGGEVLRLRRSLDVVGGSGSGSGASWTAEAGEGAERMRGSVDAERIEALLSALTGMRAGTIEIGTYPAAEEIARVTLLGFSDEPLDTVRCARRADGRTILENGDGVLRVHGAIELPVERAALGFRATSPSAQPAGDGSGAKR